MSYVKLVVAVGLLVGLSGCAALRVTPAKWDGHVWRCPPTKDTWVDEGKAFDPARPRNFVYCVPRTPAERKGAAR